MSAARIIHDLEMEGVTVRVDQGALKLIGRAEAVARVKSIAVEHKVEIINQLTGGASGLPDQGEHLAASASFLDPVEAGYIDACKAMSDRSECRGYPQACPRCRLLIADLKTCLLGPEAEHVATASQEPAGAPKDAGRANGRKNSQSPAAGRTERKTQGRN